MKRFDYKCNSCGEVKPDHWVKTWDEEVLCKEGHIMIKLPSGINFASQKGGAVKMNKKS